MNTLTDYERTCLKTLKKLSSELGDDVAEAFLYAHLSAKSSRASLLFTTLGSLVKRGLMSATDVTVEDVSGVYSVRRYSLTASGNRALELEVV